MAKYRVQRTFGGNKRGSKVELTKSDADNLLGAGYISEIQSTSEPAKRAPRKRAAKKTTAPTTTTPPAS